MRVLSAGLLCISFTCSSVLAQFSGGVNIDFNVAAGAGAGQPSILFGGAAGQGGYWNPLNAPYGLGAVFTVRNLGNSADAVTLNIQSTNSSTSFAFNNPNATGDTGLLLNDIHDVGTDGYTIYTVGPFAGGVYDVYTYAVAPDSATNRMTIGVNTTSTPSTPLVDVGGAIPAGGVLTDGVTHSVHRVAVARGERVFIGAGATVGAGSVNGLQIKPVTGVTRLYVKGDAPAGGQTGLSWGAAMTDLQRAISVANDTPSVTEIWVAGGVHRADRVINTAGDRAASFRPRGGLSIIGSFAGTEATLAQRTNLTAHPTVLSGDLGVPGVRNDNTKNLMYTPTSGGTLTVDGLVFADAFTEEAAWASIDGSALHVGTGTAVARNCVFRDCEGFDAAVVVDAGGHGTVTDSVFERNTSARITSLRVEGDGTVANVDRCTFRDDTMVGAFLGEVISCNFGSTMTLTNSLIHDNNRRSPGAGMFMLGVTSATVTVDNCTFANNTGGGMYISTGFAGSTPNFACHNCIMWGNRRGIFPSGTIEDQQFRTAAGATDVLLTDSSVEGWTETRFAGLANNGLNPRFIDADGLDNTPGTADDNYRLGSRSPSRDSAWLGGLSAAYRTLDRDLNPRVIDDPLMINTGFASGTTPLDRGCYEAQAASAACPGDMGSAGGLPGADGIRDNNDFIVFINYFFFLNALADVGIGGGFPGSDGVFDNNDFIAFIDLFFAECP